MDKVEFIKQLQEIAQSINPLEMITHSENCESCKMLLMTVQIVINNHMTEKK